MACKLPVVLQLPVSPTCLCTRRALRHLPVLVKLAPRRFLIPSQPSQLRRTGNIAPNPHQLVWNRTPWLAIYTL